jgi:glutathione synthase
MALRILYVMDPMTRVLVDKDTTFAFQLEGQKRGHEQYHCLIGDLFVDRAVPHATARRLTVERADTHFRLDEARIAPLAGFDVIFMRKDPPFDMPYVFASLLLGLVDPKVTFVINDPRGVVNANEKLYALNFPDVIPESLVSADHVRLKAFMESLGGEMIVKPLDGCGGAGVLHVHRGDRNLNALLEMSTLDGTRLVMAQRYLRRCARATSASSCSTASRSAASSACRARTSIAATSTSAARSCARPSTIAIARSARRWRRGFVATGSTSWASTSSAASSPR